MAEAWWEKVLQEQKETPCFSELYRHGCGKRVCNFKHFHNDERYAKIVNVGRARAEEKKKEGNTLCRYGYDCYNIENRECWFLHPYDEVQDEAWKNDQEVEMFTVPEVDPVEITDDVKKYVNFLCMKKCGVELLP